MSVLGVCYFCSVYTQCSCSVLHFWCYRTTSTTHLIIQVVDSAFLCLYIIFTVNCLCNQSNMCDTLSLYQQIVQILILHTLTFYSFVKKIVANIWKVKTTEEFEYRMCQTLELLILQYYNWPLVCLRTTSAVPTFVWRLLKLSSNNFRSSSACLWTFENVNFSIKIIAKQIMVSA